MSLPQCFIMNINRMVSQGAGVGNNAAKPSVSKEKVMSYEEKSVGSTSFFKCEACPYMALAEDDIKFHLFTEHPDLARTNGLADNIQIPCPGCTNIFVAEETLRTHLRNHHKMGIKDVKKMVKSLIQIALKNAKLKKAEDPPPPVPVMQDIPNAMPEVIEIVPDNASARNETLPKGVAFISVDELQKMSTPNFEKVDPKEIIQEASINIVYSNDISHQYVNVVKPSTSNNTCNVLKMSSVTPDLISSIQPRITTLDNTNNLSPHTSVESEAIPLPVSNLPKLGRPKGSRSIQNYTNKGRITEKVKEKNLGKLCSVDGCHTRLKDPEKLLYHRKCHQNGKLHCPECDHLAVDVDSLHTHLWKTHSLDMELLSCKICGYKTYKKHRYNVHMKCHGDETYPCPTCSRIFKSTGLLKKHSLTHQSEDSELLPCSLCQLEFKSIRCLKVHITEVHKKMKPYNCSHCDYTAARKEELKLHLRSHTGDKPYSCDQCNYRSGDHNAMRRHKKRHSHENTYSCKYCPYTTIQSTRFTVHMISKHPEVNSEDIHCCPYCSFKSVNREKFICHLTNHPDEKGVQLLIEMKTAKATAVNTKPRWTIPSGNDKDNASDISNADIEKVPSPSKDDVAIEVYDCDSQQDSIKQQYPENYSSHTTSDAEKPDFNNQVLVSDLSKEDVNSDCVMSESSNDTMIDRHSYPPQQRLQNIPFDNTQTNLRFLSTAVSLEQNILQSTNVNSLVPIDIGMNNSLNNFPIRLTLKPVDKIFPMTKVTGPIIKPTQILPVPSSSNSPVNTTIEPEGVPRKKPKISVKSNLILKGPDQVNMFHSQQKMAFKRLEDNERYGLGPVTFNNLITTQFMQLPPEPTLSESPNNILPYPQEPMLAEAPTPPVDATISDASQMFTFNQQMTNSMSVMPPQPKIQTTDPSYIKLEGTIKQNTQSPSLESMCSANVIQNITREYKASPPLEYIHKNMSEIKNEVKSDYYSIPLSSSEATPGMMDQYLMDNMIGEQFAAHLDLSTIVLPLVNEEQQNDGDVIEIDDNSDDTKMLPRFDMNFPLESMYLMHNDFHFLDNDIPTSDVPVNEMNRMVTEVPIINQKESLESSDGPSNDFPNFIEGKKDPMMNTSVRLSTNKINVKNIESMKN